MNEHLYESEFHRAITGNARERVGYILQRNVVARNDDMECLWEYFRLFDQATTQIGEPPGPGEDIDLSGIPFSEEEEEK